MGESPQRAAGLPPITRAEMFGRWLAGFLVAAFLMFFDPFGFGQAASRASEDIVLAWFAPVTSDPAQATEGQERITVVLIDDALLDGLSQELGRRITWPMSRVDQLAYVYGPILDRAPSAMFVDVVLHQESAGGPDDLDAFTLALARRLDRQPEDNPTRLIFADRPRPTDGRVACSFRRTTPAALVDTSHVAPAFRRFAAGRSEMEFAISRSWGPANRYPLAPLALGSPESPDAACAPFPPGADIIASPALALFSHWCEREGGGMDKCQGVSSGRRTGSAEAFPLHRVPHHYATASAPVWRWYQSPSMQEIQRKLLADDDPCRRLNGQSTIKAIWRAARLRSEDESRPGFNPCYAIDTLSAADIIRLGGRGLDDTDLNAMLTNRLVLVGTQLDSAPDRLPSPVNGVASGVMLHAVTLENLLTDGKQRTADAQSWNGFDLPLVCALCLAALLAVPLNGITDRMLQRLDAAVGHWHPALRWMTIGLLVGLLLFIAFAIPMLLALVLFCLTSWAPINWMPILFAKLLVGTAIARSISTRHAPALDLVRTFPARLGGDTARSYCLAAFALTGVVVLASAFLA